MLNATIIAILVLIALAVLWIVVITIKAARMERKQQSDLDKIRHMDNAELSDIINQYKRN